MPRQHLLQKRTLNVSLIQRNLMSSYDKQKNEATPSTSTFHPIQPRKYILRNSRLIEHTSNDSDHGSNITHCDIHIDKNHTPSKTTQEDQFVIHNSDLIDDISDCTDDNVNMTQESMDIANRKSLRDFPSMSYLIGYAANPHHNKLTHNETTYDKQILVAEFNTSYHLLTYLEKAYDLLHWDFFINTLKDLSFNNHFVSIIKHCMDSCSMQVLANKEKTMNEFLVQRYLTLQFGFSSAQNEKLHLEECGLDCPTNGMLKLNVDGSIIQGGRKVTYGGILRNEMGFWLTSFSYNLGSYSVLRVALMGILIGLRLAWEKGFRNVWLEDRQHIKRNSVADKLGAKGHDLLLGFHLFEQICRGP
ncbi:hypothetical protein JHK82_055811 [Glycine max]|nr:hypothetical protein JHK82_055811 [Glycine max]